MHSTGDLTIGSNRPNLHWVASSLLHLVLLGCILYPSAVSVAPMRLPGTRNGSHLELSYSPGRAPVHTSAPNPKVKPQLAAAATPLPVIARNEPKPVPPSPNSTSPASTQPDSAAGADALGDGNVSIALAAFFPRPRPDLSSLAHGTAGDVILDIVIDSAGRIADIKVTRSLGPDIDQTVIATVHQWTFHPATKDGQPVASEQELHFHYERS